MYVISDFNLSPSRILVSTKNCRPVPVLPEDGEELITGLPLSIEETVAFSLGMGFLVLIAVVVVLLVLVGALCRPQCLSKISRRPPDKEKNPASHQLLLHKEVLLLHARDISDNNNLAMLKEQLHSDFKIHDIFESRDPEKLADSSGWLHAMLLKDSRVKLLLVESAALQDQIHTLLETSKESYNLPVTKEVKAVHDRTPQVVCDGDALLTFALRHILSMELRQDYSRVFVARFADAQQEGFLQMEDSADLIVKTKRYNLPSHYHSLKEDLLR